MQKIVVLLILLVLLKLITGKELNNFSWFLACGIAIISYLIAIF